MKYLLAILLTLLLLTPGFTQPDTTNLLKSKYTRYDSVFLARINSNGNIMIAAGVGLTGVGSYLIYQGQKIYTTRPIAGTPTAAEDEVRNRRQGTIYMAAGGAAIVGGIVLAAFGIRNKVEIKTRRRVMALQSGLLDNRQLGFTLFF
jgi:hypothetical protein